MPWVASSADANGQLSESDPSCSKQFTGEPQGHTRSRSGSARPSRYNPAQSRDLHRMCSKAMQNYLGTGPENRRASTQEPTSRLVHTDRRHIPISTHVLIVFLGSAQGTSRNTLCSSLARTSLSGPFTLPQAHSLSSFSWAAHSFFMSGILILLSAAPPRNGHSVPREIPHRRWQ